MRKLLPLSVLIICQFWLNSNASADSVGANERLAPLSQSQILSTQPCHENAIIRGTSYCTDELGNFHSGPTHGETTSAFVDFSDED